MENRTMYAIGFGAVLFLAVIFMIRSLYVPSNGTINERESQWWIENGAISEFPPQ